jgi:hypothetical protein
MRTTTGVLLPNFDKPMKDRSIHLWHGFLLIASLCETAADMCTSTWQSLGWRGWRSATSPTPRHDQYRVPSQAPRDDKIVQFLLWLRDNCGFRFGLVTADSFQSEHLLQTLYAEGIPTNRQSVDRDKKAYLVWRVGFQENNIRLYHQPQLLKEITGLVELDTKIDHQPNGNKDTTDAAAGAYLNAISSDEILILNIPQEPPAVVGILGHSNRLPEDPFGFTNRLPSRPPASFQRVILSSVHAESGPGESHEKHSLFINISHKTNPFQPIY